MPPSAMGLRSHFAVSAKEKRVVNSNPTNRQARATTCAPIELNPARNPSASTVPRRPPGGQSAAHLRHIHQRKFGRNRQAQRA